MKNVSTERRSMNTEKFKSHPFYMRVWGEYAMFTDPLTKGGGEKFSYQVPTYQALKGIVEAAYWKPVLYYVIDEVKILKPIQTETHGVRAPLNKGGNDLNYYTYLRDVEYLLKFHFEWNEVRNDLMADRNEIKHQEILIRSMKRGGRRDVFLGTRECVGYVDYLNKYEYENAKTAYTGENRSFGIQFHSFIYPDENLNHKEGEANLISNFCNTLMNDGCIQFCRPEDCEIQHKLGTYKIKTFNKEDYLAVDEEYQLLRDDESKFPLVNGKEA